MPARLRLHKAFCSPAGVTCRLQRERRGKVPRHKPTRPVCTCLAHKLQSGMLWADNIWLKWGLRILGAGGGFAALALGLICILQEKLIYLPRIPGLPNDFVYLPDKWGMAYEDVELEAADGVKLHAWLMWPASWSKQELRRQPVVCFFQENAGNMSLRLPFLRLLARHIKCAVFAPSYRGYGRSEGSPNEAGLKLDGQASLEWLQRSSTVNNKQIVLFGRSLGGAVAVEVAASNPGAVSALIIENTFTSIEEVAPKVMPLLRPFLGPGRPFNFLIRNKWRSGLRMQQLQDLPMLLLSSLQDEMLPPEQMLQLFNSVKKSGNARFVPLMAGHMDAYERCPQEYWTAVRQFAEARLPQAGHDTDTHGVAEAEQADAEGVRPAGGVPGASGTSSMLRSRRDATQKANGSTGSLSAGWEAVAQQEGDDA